MRIRFGQVVLDQGTRELLHRGRVVEVFPKAYGGRRRLDPLDARPLRVFSASPGAA